MNDKPIPTMVAFTPTLRARLRASVGLTNEATIDALTAMAFEEPAPVDAIIKGLRQLCIGRALLRQKNQES